MSDGTKAEIDEALLGLAGRLAIDRGLTKTDRGARLREAWVIDGEPLGLSLARYESHLAESRSVWKKSKRVEREHPWTPPLTAPSAPPSGAVSVDIQAELDANPELAQKVADGELYERAKAIRAEIEAARNPLPPVDSGSLRELLARKDSPKSRISGLMPAESRLLITAQRKSGKTTLVGNLARSLLTGDVFLGRYPVEPLAGSVMILNYEVTGSTLAGWLADMDFPEETLDRLHLVTLRGAENLLATESGRARLVAMMRERRTEVLVVDVFARAFGGDQNSNSEVAAWLGLLDRVATDGGASELVLVAHSGWNASGRSRGASALEDWPDVIANLETEKTAEGESSPTGARYFRAFGRDVDIEKGRLDFDPATRRLIYTGENQVTVRRGKKADELSTPILDFIKEIPGITSGDLKARLRRAEIPHRDGDVTPVIKVLAEAGEVVSHRDGRFVHHWVPKDVPEKFRNAVLDPGGRPM